MWVESCGITLLVVSTSSLFSALPTEDNPTMNDTPWFDKPSEPELRRTRTHTLYDLEVEFRSQG